MCKMLDQYHVTSRGRRVMGALIEIRHKEYPARIQIFFEIVMVYSG